MPLGAFILGAIVGGVLFGCSEVLWINLKPFLPFETLRLQSLLPPRDFAGFVGVATATYAMLGATAGAAGALVLRLAGVRLSPVAAFFSGAGLAFAAFAFAAAVVWLNLLVAGKKFFGSAMLLRYGFAALVIGLVVGLLCVWGGRRAARLSRAFLTVGVVLPAALLATAFTAHTRIEYSAREDSAAPAPGRPNLLLVTIDTLRADQVGTYGGPVKTPVLDRLSAEGVRFAQAISASPLTTPSHVSIFTSVYPFAHGAKNGVPMRPGLATLPQRLAGLGYYAAAFISAYTTQSNVTGLGDAFDLYSDSLNPAMPFLARDTMEPLVVYRLLDRMAGNQIPAPVVNARVEEWLDDHPPEPFFVWVHYFDVHGPFEPAPEYAAQYPPAGASQIDRELAGYRAEIAYTDSMLGEMLDGFHRRGLLDDTIVVVTSDHGEAFKEPHPHVDQGHGRHLYDSVVWVPLVFWGPGRIASGVVVEEQVQTIDIAPTLLALLGEDLPPSFVGRSLASSLASGPSLPPGLAFSQTSNLYRPRWFGIRDGEWKLLVNPDDTDEELFNLVSDPGETENLVASRPEVANRFRRQLSESMDLDAEGVGIENVDSETIERLRELGYLQDD